MMKNRQEWAHGMPIPPPEPYGSSCYRRIQRKGDSLQKFQPTKQLESVRAQKGSINSRWHPQAIVPIKLGKRWIFALWLTRSPRSLGPLVRMAPLIAGEGL